MSDEEKVLSPRLILSILSIALIAFTDIMLETALNVSFPVLMEELHVSSSTVQWLTSGVILLTTMVIVMSSWLKDSFKNRTQFIAAGLISLVGILIDAVSNQFPLILFGRLLQGVGAGVGLPLMNNVIFEQVPMNRRGTMVGLASLIVSFSPALGPAFGGFLTDAFGWHMIFWVVVPVQLFALVLGWMTITTTVETKRVKFDLIGWLLLSAFFIGGLITIDRMATDGLFNVTSLIALAAFVFGILGYYFYARKETQPLLAPSLFAKPMFRLAVIAGFIIQMINLTFNYAIPMGLQIVLHMNSSMAGLALFPGALMQALMAIVSGALYDRYGAKLPNGLGVAFLILGCFWMAFLPFGFIIFIIGFAFMQTGVGFFNGNNMTNAISNMDRADQNAGNSIFAAMQNYSAAVGIALAACIVSIFQNSAANMATGTGLGIRVTYFMDAVLIIVAAFMSFRVMKKSNPEVYSVPVDESYEWHKEDDK
ncbi:multidrug efflux MFS transporter [Fructobacillus sp. M2-14]|uniref:Multidrug efflux MFS transporter n=1 Tax=Fructobacillus broussonetiae TaxID=2713173 RepID=A0ABS5R2L1_9LACO|nr:MFS transporter [Fructobacillus broussonetiae]MBS9338896.1 multidrug efflux MFS transporter [Fructobacillus broussonetiae]